MVRRCVRESAEEVEELTDGILAGRLWHARNLIALAHEAKELAERLRNTRIEGDERGTSTAVELAEEWYEDKLLEKEDTRRGQCMGICPRGNVQCVGPWPAAVGVDR